MVFSVRGWMVGRDGGGLAYDEQFQAHRILAVKAQRVDPAQAQKQMLDGKVSRSDQVSLTTGPSRWGSRKDLPIGEADPVTLSEVIRDLTEVCDQERPAIGSFSAAA